MKRSSSDRILMLLKMRREATSLVIAKELDITKEGARKHLLNLTERGLIQSEARSERVGRPTTYYSLTKEGLAEFPDTHAQITVQLLQSVKNILGENALNLLINDREKNVYARYATAMEKSKTVEQKLNVLSEKRTEEGYMAEWKKEKDTYYFIENHCPICAAATACQGFCQSELNNFQELIGNDYIVSREEYIIEGGNRCTYKIEEV